MKNSPISEEKIEYIVKTVVINFDNFVWWKHELVTRATFKARYYSVKKSFSCALMLSNISLLASLIYDECSDYDKFLIKTDISVSKVHESALVTVRLHLFFFKSVPLRS